MIASNLKVMHHRQKQALLYVHVKGVVPTEDVKIYNTTSYIQHQHHMEC